MLRIHHAAHRNDVKEVQALLDADPDLVEAEVPLCKMRPLHYAARSGAKCVKLVKLLLERGADPNALTSGGHSPLMLACAGGNPSVVKVLLQAPGVDPALQGERDGMNSLMRAADGYHSAGSKHAEVVRLLLEDGRVPINARDSDGRTALLTACCAGNFEIARRLLVEGVADPTLADREGQIPIGRAQGSPHNHSFLKAFEVR